MSEHIIRKAMGSMFFPAFEDTTKVLDELLGNDNCALEELDVLLPENYLRFDAMLELEEMSIGKKMWDGIDSGKEYREHSERLNQLCHELVDVIRSFEDYDESGPDAKMYGKEHMHYVYERFPPLKVVELKKVLRSTWEHYFTMATILRDCIQM